MSRLCKSLGRINFFKNKVSVLEVELFLRIKSIEFRQPKLSASDKENVAGIFQLVNVNSSTGKS